MNNIIKHLSIAAIAVAALIVSSCTDEGPHVVGEFKYDVKVLYTTPEFAIVEISLPEDTDDNLITGLSSTNYGYRLYNAEGVELNSSYDSVVILEEQSEGDHVRKVKILYKKLDSNTTYFVGLEPYKKNWGGYIRVFNTGISFTTSRKGDYSGIGGFKYKVLESNDFYTYVKIIPPEGFYLKDHSSYLLVSKSEDMSNSIQEYYGSQADDSLIFRFYKLKSDTYYLKFVGDIYVKNSSGDYIEACDYASIPFLDPMTLSVYQTTGKLISQTAQFSVFELTLSKGVTNSDFHRVYYTIQRKDGSISEQRYSDACVWQFDATCTVSIAEKLSKGDRINFELNGDFAYVDPLSGKQDVFRDINIYCSMDIETDATDNCVSLKYQSENGSDYIIPTISNTFKDDFTLYINPWGASVYFYVDENALSEQKYVLEGELDSNDRFKLNKSITTLQKGHKYIVSMTNTNISLIKPEMTVASYTQYEPLVFAWTYE